VNDWQDANRLEVTLDSNLVLVIEVLQNLWLTSKGILKLEVLSRVDSQGSSVDEGVDALNVEAW